MSIFDDHTSNESLQSFKDTIIRNKYKLSNSGNTLIPKNKDQNSGIVRTFKEEKSIFRSMYGEIKSKLNNTIEDIEYLYSEFQEIIRNMNISRLEYNHKIYYKINHELKKEILSKIYSDFNI